MILPSLTCPWPLNDRSLLVGVGNVVYRPVPTVLRRTNGRTVQTAGPTVVVVEKMGISIRFSRQTAGQYSPTSYWRQGTVHELQATVPQGDSPATKLFIDLRIANHDVRFQVDTGATVSLVNLLTYARLGYPALDPPSRRLVAYGDSAILLKGQLTTLATYKTVTRPVTLFVVNSHSAGNIFGLDAFSLFGFSISDEVQVISDTVPFQELDDLCASFA